MADMTGVFVGALMVALVGGAAVGWGCAARIMRESALKRKRLLELERQCKKQVVPLLYRLGRLEEEARMRRAIENPVGFMSNEDMLDGLGKSTSADDARKLRQEEIPAAIRTVLCDLGLPVTEENRRILHLGAAAKWGQSRWDPNESVDRQCVEELERLLAS